MPPAQDSTNDATIDGLRKVIQALKRRCDRLERTIGDLVLRCNTHERLLNEYRLEIVGYKDHKGTLNTDYQGEKFDLMDE